jgi:hypothetical protein
MYVNALIKTTRKLYLFVPQNPLFVINRVLRSSITPLHPWYGKKDQFVNWSLSATSHNFIELLSQANSTQAKSSMLSKNSSAAIVVELKQFKKAVEDHKKGHQSISCRDPQHHTHAIRHFTIVQIGKQEETKRERERVVWKKHECMSSNLIDERDKMFGKGRGDDRCLFIGPGGGGRTERRRKPKCGMGSVERLRTSIPMDIRIGRVHYAHVELSNIFWWCFWNN